MNKDDLVKKIKTAAKDTPYLIEETDKGFILTLNIVDEKWYTILQKNGLRKTFHLDATVLESVNKVKTSDTMREIKWRAGGLAPTLGGSISVKKGEFYDAGFRKDLGVSEEGKVGKVVDYNFSLSEVKEWLDSILNENGYKRALGTEAKIGLIVAIVAILGVLPIPFLILFGVM